MVSGNTTNLKLNNAFRLNKTWLSLLAVCFLVLFSFQSCKEEIGDDLEKIDPLPQELEVEMISVDIQGYILGIDNNPVKDVGITSGNKNTVTNSEGYFLIKDAEVNRNAVVIKAAKEGYFEGVRTFIATSGKINNVEIIINNKEETGVFSATSGGTVSLPATKITFPANAILTLDNKPYDGNVSVSIVYLNPTDEKFILAMPGDLRAIDSKGNLCGLSSLGLFGVELNGVNGEKLKLNSNIPASVELVVPETLLAKAPATVPIWHFDERNGLWSEEGNATLSGNVYKTEVKHFSYWNFDDPSMLVNLKFRLVDHNNNPVTGESFVAYTTDNFLYHGLGQLNEDGYFSGSVPKEGEYTLIVNHGKCSRMIFSQSITPNNINIDLGTIRVTIEEYQYTRITGKVINCNNELVTDGAVSIEFAGYYNRTVVEQDGTFKFNILRCTPEEKEAVILVTDRATSQTGNMTTIVDVGEYDLGTIVACGKKMKNYVKLQFKGKEISFTGEEEVFAYSNGGWSHFNFIAWSDHSPVMFSLRNSRGSTTLGNNTLMSTNFFDEDGVLWRLVEGILNVEEFAIDQDQPDVRKDIVVGYLKGIFTAKIKSDETSEITDLSGTINVSYGSFLKD